MGTVRHRLALVAACVSGLALSLMPSQASAATSAGSLVVHTDKGAVRGVRADGVDSFLGIRYAAAPVGDLRWRPPQPVAPWSGVMPAEEFGNRCPAAASTNGPRSETEDCLFVNVQRPTGVRRGDGRAVYVFIHGGGFVNGSSNQADMAQIVQQTGVIGVSMNYRLGALGFLGLPGLTAEADQSGNYGLMDQQAALRWVQRNIAAFGGDPARVTLGGESAGAFSVCVHMVAPGSAGLFAQAMLQSGACVSQTRSAAETAGSSFATAVGCDDPATAVECLRSTPVGTLLDTAYPGSILPVRGTPFLPQDPRAAIATGQFRRVPVVIGANRDEGRTFAQGDIGWTEAQYVDWVTTTFGAASADAVLAHYPWPATSDRFTAAYLVGAVMTDSGLLAGIGGCTNRQLTADIARFTRTYAYEFDHLTGPGLTPIPGYVWGAGHAAELAYLFPSFDNGTPIAPTFNAGERQLARDMKGYWGAFTRLGAPRVSGQAAWPRYDTRRVVLSLRAAGRSVAISDAELRAEHQCAFWATVPPPTAD